MTAEEVEKYLNQVAFSGAEEFVKKYQGQNENNIIGKFGLGFYSAFMVSDKVEVFTRSFREGTKAARWECDGSPEYILEETGKDQRGTDVVLHINSESAEFLDETRIEGILKRFCRFLPVPIFFKGEQINNTQPPG
jgi:Molecular chaperone, HSP90 family